MKFIADPESRRACTEREISMTGNCTTVVSGCIFMIVGPIILTKGRGGRIEHNTITCPPAPQYRHSTRVSRLCRSTDESRFVSTCMGSLHFIIHVLFPDFLETQEPKDCRGFLLTELQSCFLIRLSLSTLYELYELFPFPYKLHNKLIGQDCINIHKNTFLVLT